MRITISTIIDNQNYGNRLQNYALQTVLEKMGHQVVTIDRPALLAHITKKEKLKNYLITGEILSKVRIHSKFFLQKILKKRGMDRQSPRSRSTLDSKNSVSFSSFTANHMKMTPPHTVNIWQWVNNHTDLLVIGSDQVWNYNFWSGATIEFALPVKIRKISYAASIGVDSIPIDLKKVYQKGLSSLAAITVREHSGRQLVKSLIDVDAPVVLDPTLLLDQQDWGKIMQAVELRDKNYLLTYFLNYPTEENTQIIQKFAKDHHLTIIDIFSQGTTSYSPGQLLYLISHASFIYTDSFHASVFSIIFNRAFKTLPRNHPVAMGSRLKTLFKTLEISQDGIGLDQLVQYEQINDRLLKERQRSKRILQQMVSQ